MSRRTISGVFLNMASRKSSMGLVSLLILVPLRSPRVSSLDNLRSSDQPRFHPVTSDGDKFNRETGS